MAGSDRTWRLVDGLGIFSLGLGTAQLVAPGAMNRLVGAKDTQANRAVQRWLGGAREIAAGIGIETRRSTTGWLWARVAGDVLDVSLLGLVLADPWRRPDERRRAAAATVAVLGVTAADITAALRLSRGAGRETDGRGTGDMADIEAKAMITVNRPLGEVFRFWHDVENLPQFMAHLQSVRSLGGGRSRWRAKAPAGMEIEWEAEITGEEIDEYIAWRSVAGARVQNSGEVRFRPAPGDRGTEIRVRLHYRPPAGKLGAAVAKLFGEEPGQQVRDDLRRFKQVMETGEVVRSEASPEGTTTRRLIAQRPAQPLPA
ncbi:SRPBCC family protein [Pseudonocardia sp. H11422]|uniref:SRPBCC family protein n=1 Tax=Pseudonocardia sp. H11422 TaxID=2835866 RepID=UPI0027E3A0B7|nr:SRPBCC family protein [Pseudonocardia sp. H11422]